MRAAPPSTCMNRRMRSASARSRIDARRECLRRTLEAHEAPNERVVAGVRGVGILAAQPFVEATLGRGERIRDVVPDAAQSRGADGDEQRLVGFDSALEVCDSLSYEI